jgi:hypothetical protein
MFCFFETLAAYVQHKILKQITLFFEQAALVAQIWLQTIDSLIDLKTKYNTAENLLKDTNN